MRKPKQVPLKLTKCGYTLELFQRQQNSVIYRKTKEGNPRTYYEVHRIRRAKSDSKPSAMIEVVAGDERLATSEEFGTYAWQVDTIDEALKRVTEIEDDIKAKESAK